MLVHLSGVRCQHYLNVLVCTWGSDLGFVSSSNNTVARLYSSFFFGFPSAGSPVLFLQTAGACHCNINSSCSAFSELEMRPGLARACPYTPVNTQSLRCTEGSMCSQCGWEFAGVDFAFLVGNTYPLPLEIVMEWVTGKCCMCSD